LRTGTVDPGQSDDIAGLIDKMILAHRQRRDPGTRVFLCVHAEGRFACRHTGQHNRHRKKGEAKDIAGVQSSYAVVIHYGSIGMADMTGAGAYRGCLPVLLPVFCLVDAALGGAGVAAVPSIRRRSSSNDVEAPLPAVGAAGDHRVLR
jgi:hypothetical protein